MKWKKYGITLSRLTEEDLELVRQWRNSSLINRYMEFRKYITPEMQKKWFESIDNFNNFYYIIIYKNEKIGLINEKNINWEAKISEGGDKSSEAGLFIWETKYAETFVPILTSLCLIEIGFYLLQWTKTYIRVLKGNKKAIEYNMNLGFNLCEGQEDINNQLYVLTKQSFEQKAKKIRKSALEISGNDNTLYLILEKADYLSGIAQKIENIINSLPFSIKCERTKEETVYYYEM